MQVNTTLEIKHDHHFELESLEPTRPRNGSVSRSNRVIDPVNVTRNYCLHCSTTLNNGIGVSISTKFPADVINGLTADQLFSSAKIQGLFDSALLSLDTGKKYECEKVRKKLEKLLNKLTKEFVGCDKPMVVVSQRIYSKGDTVPFKKG